MKNEESKQIASDNVQETLSDGDAVLLPLLNDREFSTEFFIIAGLTATLGEALSASARKTDHSLCPRCRKLEPLLPIGLCQRCAEVIK